MFEHEIVTCIPKAKDNNGELTVGELTLGERTQADNYIGANGLDTVAK